MEMKDDFPSPAHGEIRKSALAPEAISRSRMNMYDVVFIQYSRETNIPPKTGKHPLDDRTLFVSRKEVDLNTS